MGINKSIELPTGITVSYWKIATVTLNYIAGTATLLLFGYKDKEARLDGKDCIEERYISIPMIDSRASFYDALKETEEFKDAENA